MLRKKLLVITSFFIAMTWVLPQITPIDNYITDSKLYNYQQHETLYGIENNAALGTLSGAISYSDSQEKLLNDINKLAKKHYEAPINAKIDPVWKGIPGYNGVEVDVEKTYKLALSKQKVDKLELIFNEIPPDINLEDLPPSPIYKGNPKKKMVSLMINVAWGNEYLDTMLTTLDEANVRATFFLDGSWLKKNVDMAKIIKEKGHEISNHAYSHKDMSKYSEPVQRAEIQKTEDLLKEKLQVNNTLFAPPSGDYNQTTVNIAHDLNLKTILWTIDTVDWKKPKPEWIVRKIGSRLEPGSLILMHPTESSSQALKAMISEITNKGYAIGTVSDLISPQRKESVETPFDF
jgi:probable sporulation protein (polysaccharide deacetylase family)